MSDSASSVTRPTSNPPPPSPAVTAGSSEFRQAAESVLQLKLTLNKGAHTEDVFMELSLPDFYDFLSEMEKAKSSLEFLS